MQPWHFRSAVELAEAIRHRAISARDLLEHCLDRIDRLNPQINAVVVQDRDGARAAADAADAALAAGATGLGPLHGVPITVKEQFDLRGFPSTFGIPALRDHRASADALAVERLKRAGAVLIGKTNTPFEGSDIQTYNDIYGVTQNPWRPGLTPGGSSGGSAAALAAGFSALELGSDIGGSIRNPAHSCGVFGHKPTHGLLPPRGHGALAPLDLVVIGPLARSASDLALALDLLGQPDESDAYGLRYDLPALTEPTRDLRIAVWGDDPRCPVSAAVAERLDAVCAALAAEGARIDRRARPDFDVSHTHRLYVELLDAATSGGIPDQPFAELLDAARDLDPADETRHASYVRHRTLPHRTWLRRNERRARVAERWHAFFREHDFLLAPIMPIAAFPHDHRPFAERELQVDDRRQPYLDILFWAGLASLCYLPATAIPAGLSADGLPIGIQIIGPRFADRRTIGLAQRLEQAGFGFIAPATLREGS